MLANGSPGPSSNAETAGATVPGARSAALLALGAGTRYLPAVANGGNAALEMLPHRRLEPRRVARRQGGEDHLVGGNRVGAVIGRQMRQELGPQHARCDQLPDPEQHRVACRLDQLAMD